MYTVRVMLWMSTIERYVAPGGDLTRDYREAQQLPREAVAAVAEHHRKIHPKSCVDVFDADPSANDGRPVDEYDLEEQA